MKRLVFVLVIVGVALGFLSRWRGETPASRPEGARPTSTAKVERGPIRLTVASTGRVVSNLDVEIKCKASGQIVTLPYDVSDTVRKGDKLVELDPIDEQRRLQQAEIALAASQARLEQARQNLLMAERTVQTGRKRAEAALPTARARAKETQAKAERVKALLDKKLTSEEVYETARTAQIGAAGELANAEIRIEEIKTEELALESRRQDVLQVEAQVKSNQIDLSLAQQRVGDTVVLAPMDGVVSKRDVQIGQIISSGISNVGGGTTVLVLSDLTRTFVLASVDESDIGRVEVGQSATITADAYPGVGFRGKVVRIATRGLNTQNVVTFEVKIEVLGDNRRLLKPEMTANIDILAAEKDDVLLVPAEALVRREGKRLATVQKADGSTEERPVETGLSDGAQVEILEGLNEGETVLVRRGEGESRWRGGPGGLRGAQQRMMFGGGGRRGG